MHCATKYRFLCVIYLNFRLSVSGAAGMASSKRDRQVLVEDEDELVDNDELDIELQPHLSHLHSPPRLPAEHHVYVGPAGQDDVSESSSQRVVQADVTPASLQHPTSSAASNVVNGAASQTPTSSTNGIAAEGHSVTGTDQSATAVPPTPPNPVFYDGQSVVVQAPVVTTRPDGTRTIQTHHLGDHWREHERPLRQRKMKILKIASVVALIVFFPTGIPAAYFAWRTEKEFEEGIMRGNIDRALKFAKRTEHLIIFSFVLVIAVVILTFALVEKTLAENDAYVHRGIITG